MFWIKSLLFTSFSVLVYCVLIVLVYKCGSVVLYCVLCLGTMYKFSSQMQDEIQLNFIKQQSRLEKMSSSTRERFKRRHSEP